MGNHLIIFIKNPLKGHVKTRIAATTGDDQALGIYVNLLDITRENVKNLNCNKYLFYSKFIDQWDNWHPHSFLKFLQIGKDLGIRMQNAFNTVFSGSLAEKKKVAIIGSDCPELEKAILQTAFNKLDEHDFVVGPTHDGGYYLLGMKEFWPNVFKNIPWSTEHVLSSTLNFIDSQNLTYYLLPTYSDIDTEADWTDYLMKNSKIK